MTEFEVNTESILNFMLKNQNTQPADLSVFTKDSKNGFAQKMNVKLDDFSLEIDPKTGNGLFKPTKTVNDKLHKYQLGQIINNGPLALTNKGVSVSQPDIVIENGRFKKSFTLSKSIGQGGFGTVYKVTNNIDKRTYAVKRITLDNKEVELINQKKSKVIREIHSLSSFSHPNIVKYYSCWFENHDETLDNDLDSYTSLSSFDESNDSTSESTTNALDLFIQMEYCANETLGDFLNKRRTSTSGLVAFKLFESTLNGLKRIHEKRIIHRDLK